MAIKIDFFESIAREIEGKLNRVSYLLTKANQKSGEYHEEIIRQSLSNFLSKRYSIKTGYIYLDDKTTSKQIDILLIDESYPFTYLFQDRDFVIVRPEPVIAVIEIKTQLLEQQFRDAFDNIFIAKSIKQKALGYYGHMYGSVFGYYSNKILDNSTLDTWFKDKSISEYASKPAALWPDSIFFFNHGLFLSLDDNRQFDKKSTQAYYYKYFRNNDANDKSWQLALLITMLVASCEKEANGPISRAKSIDNIDLKEAQVSHDRFRPGMGHSRV